MLHNQLWICIHLVYKNKKLITRWKYPKVTWRMSSYLFTYWRLSTDIHWTRISPIRHKIDHTHVNLINWRHMNLNLTSQNIYSTLMCGLQIFPGPLIYRAYTVYRVTSYLRLLALSVLICSPNMSFLARLVSDSYRSLEKFELGTLSSTATP